MVDRSPSAQLPNARTTRATHSLGWSRSLHSQIRTTEYPRALNARETTIPLLLFRKIFVRQYDRFVFGIWPQFGQPCQKHPSTKTATLLEECNRSGLPIMSRGCSSQPLRARCISIARSRSSVVLLPDERMARMFSLRLELTLFFITRH